MKEPISKQLKYVSTVQPVPAISNGGDCGACCLSGVTGKSIDEIYELKGEVGALSYFDVKNVLAKIPGHLIEGFPEAEELHRGLHHFGMPSVANSHNWFNRLKWMIDGDFVGFAQINYKNEGNVNFETDHWVLLVGYSETWEDVTDETGKYIGSRCDEKVIVSCSAAGGSLYSKDKRKFCKENGGYDAIYFKPFTV